MSTRIVAMLMLLAGGGLAIVVPVLLNRTETKAEPKPLLPAEADWNCKYDLILDGEVKSDVAEIAFHFAVRNNRITGVPLQFKPGDVWTDHRLDGEVVPGPVPLLILRQDGPDGYISAYAGRRLAEGRFVGTWYDNRGGAGDFEMLLVKRGK